MDNKDYVLKHDFGYGREPELEELYKLELRNFKDLKVYVYNIISTQFVASVKGNQINFKDGMKTKVFIERI